MSKFISLLIIFTLNCGFFHSRKKGKAIEVKDFVIQASIVDKQLSCHLTGQVEVNDAEKKLLLLGGELVWDGKAGGDKNESMSYDETKKNYSIFWTRRGKHSFSKTFFIRPEINPKNNWISSTLRLMNIKVRRVEVSLDQKDQQVELPGCIELTREIRDGKLLLKGWLLPGKKFKIKWKPLTHREGASLIMSSRSNTIATFSSSSLRCDSLIQYQISQGETKELVLEVSPDVEVTGVQGTYIKDWHLQNEENKKILRVFLNRPVDSKYSLQILWENPVHKFPAAFSMPNLSPVDCLRSSGSLAIGTDHSIQLVVKESGSLVQMDQKFFPSVFASHPRMNRPTQKCFYYQHAGAHYQLDFNLDHLSSSYDAVELYSLHFEEDQLRIHARVELDVRDAPLRKVRVSFPRDVAITDVRGKMILEDSYHLIQEKGEDTIIEIPFTQPVLGRALLFIDFEIARSPIDTLLELKAPSVEGAGSERGYVVMSAVDHLILHEKSRVGLSPIPRSSVPYPLEGVISALRFKESTWSLGVYSEFKPARIRAELFHLITLGEGVVFGSITVNYHISGASVDELSFNIDKKLGEMEFVGGDIRSYHQEAGVCKVKLNRKVIGDYNLGLFYTYHQKDENLHTGMVECINVESQGAYLALTSHINMEIFSSQNLDSVLEIEKEELPESYRLLLNAPLLKVYKILSSTGLDLKLGSYERLPTLALLIELCEAQTQIDVSENGECQTLTKIRYHIKNTDQQYLSLEIPPGSQVWSIEEIKLSESGETRRKLTSSLDGKRLKIPLGRKRNPNEALVVELTYGRKHGQLPLLGQIDLSLAKSPVPSSYTHWKIQAPKDYILEAKAGPFHLEGTSNLGVEFLLKNIGANLSVFLGSLKKNITSQVMMGLWFLWMLLLFTFRKRGLRKVFILGLCAIVLYSNGSQSLFKHSQVAPQANQLTLNRSLNLGEEKLSIDVLIAPTWAQVLDPEFAALVFCSLLFIFLGLKIKKFKKVFLALGISGLVTGLAEVQGYSGILQNSFMCCYTRCLDYLVPHGSGQKFILQAKSSLCIQPHRFTTGFTRRP